MRIRKLKNLYCFHFQVPFLSSLDAMDGAAIQALLEPNQVGRCGDENFLAVLPAQCNQIHLQLHLIINCWLPKNQQQL